VDDEVGRDPDEDAAFRRWAARPSRTCGLMPSFGREVRAPGRLPSGGPEGLGDPRREPLAVGRETGGGRAGARPGPRDGEDAPLLEEGEPPVGRLAREPPPQLLEELAPRDRERRGAVAFRSEKSAAARRAISSTAREWTQAPAGSFNAAPEAARAASRSLATPSGTPIAVRGRGREPRGSRFPKKQAGDLLLVTRARRASASASSFVRTPSSGSAAARRRGSARPPASRRERGAGG